MSCQTQVVVSPLPSGSCLPQELYDYLTEGLQVVTQECGNCVCYVSQTTSPGPEQLDYVWSLISTTGVPLFDQVYYNGEWRRKPTVPIGAELFFSGDPSTYFNPATNFGLHGGQWDGWKIELGTTGQVIAIASGFSSSGLGWIFNYLGTDSNTGGAASTALTIDNMPLHSHTYNQVSIIPSDTGGGPNSNAVVRRDFVTSTTGTSGKDPADPFSNYPPFVVKAIVIYTGLEGS